jgi:hypothetical protein
MAELLTYYDIQYNSSSKIFEAEQIKGLSPDQINEGEKLYYLLVEKLQKGEDIDEGFFGGLVGGVAGGLLGPMVGKAICKALSVDENGVLGKLLCSRLVATAIGVTLGK